MMLKLKYVSFSYREGDELFSVKTQRSLSSDRVSLEINTNGNVFSVWVRTDREIMLKDITAVFEYPFGSKERVFLNGYQSWTDSAERHINGIMHGISHIPRRLSDKYAFSQYGDYNFAAYSLKPGEMHGWSYGYVRVGSEYDFIGSLSENTGFTRIETYADDWEIRLVKDCAFHMISSDYCGLKVFMRSGSEKDVFDNYFDLLGVKPREGLKQICGYTSWYRHYQDINEYNLSEDMNALKALGGRADVFQIDDGWQTAVGDWLSVDRSKFPNYMKAMADKISAGGMMPGIWLAPFVCEKNSDIYKKHRRWILRDSFGREVRAGSNWSGAYALDIYNAAVRTYIRKVIRTVVNDWGFRLLKLDFLYAACIEPRSDRTRGQVMSDAMTFIRECAGDALILGCGVPLASAFGKVDYCRIGSDIGLSWNDKPLMRLTHRERVSTKNSILDSVFRRQLNGRAFLNDPDVFMLRPDGNSLSDEQKKCLAEVNALMGSVLFTSDNFRVYSDEEKRILKRIMGLRDAEVTSAEICGERLVVRFIYNGKKFQRSYKL